MDTPEIEEPVLLEVRGPAAFLTLNRPEFGNSVNVAMAKALLDKVTVAAQDPSIVAVVIRGSGRMFCAGGDVKSLHAAGTDLPATLREILLHLHPAIHTLATMDKPVVSAIQGPTAGVGIALAAVADIALAEPQAHFTMAYSRIGLTPDGGTSWLLPRLIGLRRAQDLSYTNRRVLATEAAQIGLITRVVTEGTLSKEVEDVVGILVSRSPGALGRTKRLLHAADGVDFKHQLDAEIEAIAAQGSNPQSQAAIASLVVRN